MTYAEYLSLHSFLHTLAGNRHLSKYPRLVNGLGANVYLEQIQTIRKLVETGGVL